MQNSRDETSFQPFTSIDPLRLKTYLHYAALAPFNYSNGVAYSRRRKTPRSLDRRCTQSSEGESREEEKAVERMLDISSRRRKPFLRGMEKLQKKYMDSCVKTCELFICLPDCCTKFGY